MLGRTRRIHFVGVGGIGMSGIAELLANLGYVVTGSDARRSDVTARLESACGVTVFEGHAAGNVGDADVVVYSSAVKRTNPEIAEAERRGIPVIPRAEMLAELMRLRFSVAVAGSHGKTTTTSMIALVLERAGLDPTAVIGGRLSVFGSNARLGRGQYMVAEADESDRSFLMLLPSIAVMTNIDHEHMETYGSFEELQRAFADFANKVPFYGSVVACVDDPHVRAVCASITRRVVTYGLDAPGGRRRAAGDRRTRRRARLVRRALHRASPRRLRRDRDSGALELTVPGRHNLQNALAAVAVAGRARHRLRRRGRDAAGLPRRRAAVRASRRGGRRARGGRLRAPPDRDRRRARRREGHARPPAGRGVPAAPLLAHRSC